MVAGKAATLQTAFLEPEAETPKPIMKKFGEPINLNDYDAKTLWKLKREVEQELQKRALAEIVDLEQQANDLREMVGFKRRPLLRKERPVGFHGMSEKSS